MDAAANQTIILPPVTMRTHIAAVAPTLLHVRAANTPKTPSLQRVKPEYHDLISSYLDLDVTSWKEQSPTLLTLLLDSGHSVDIGDDINDCRSVAVGKFGAAYSARSELLGDALIIATAHFIEFLNGTGAGRLHKNIQRQKSAMPMSTAIDWMKEGYAVRRASWPRDWLLRLHPGYMSEFTEVVTGCVLGIPKEHYRRVHVGSALDDGALHIREPLFIMTIGGTESEWKITANSALANDWLVVE